MAVIPQFQVVADSMPIEPGIQVIEGMLVKMTTDGNVNLCVGSSTERPLGIAGDTKSTSVSGLPATNNSSQGAFVNRVSDSFDETKASGLMTVYHSGGRFATDQFESGAIAAYNPGVPLYASSNSKFTTDSSGGVVVGTLITAPGAFASGVPGLDINGSLQLTGSYITLKLTV